MCAGDPLIGHYKRPLIGCWPPHITTCYRSRKRGWCVRGSGGDRPPPGSPLHRAAGPSPGPSLRSLLRGRAARTSSLSQFIRLKSLLISPRVKLQLRVRIMAPQPSIWWQNSIENCGAYNIWRWKYCLFVAPNALDRKITNIKSFNNI